MKLLTVIFTPDVSCSQAHQRQAAHENREQTDPEWLSGRCPGASIPGNSGGMWRLRKYLPNEKTRVYPHGQCDALCVFTLLAEFTGTIQAWRQDRGRSKHGLLGMAAHPK